MAYRQYPAAFIRACVSYFTHPRKNIAQTDQVRGDPSFVERERLICLM